MANEALLNEAMKQKLKESKEEQCELSGRLLPIEKRTKALSWALLGHKLSVAGEEWGRTQAKKGQ